MNMQCVYSEVRTGCL